MGLFNFFKRNSMTGTPVAFHRNIDDNLVLNIAADNGSGTYVFIACQ